MELGAGISHSKTATLFPHLFFFPIDLCVASMRNSIIFVH